MLILTWIFNSATGAKNEEESKPNGEVLWLLRMIREFVLYALLTIVTVGLFLSWQFAQFLILIGMSFVRSVLTLRIYCVGCNFCSPPHRSLYFKEVYRIEDFPLLYRMALIFSDTFLNIRFLSSELIGSSFSTK